jgi:hypothetical protein
MSGFRIIWEKWSPFDFTGLDYVGVQEAFQSQAT